MQAAEALALALYVIWNIVGRRKAEEMEDYKFGRRLRKELLNLCYDSDYTIGAMLKQQATTRNAKNNHLKVTKSLITHTISQLNHMCLLFIVYNVDLNFVCRRKQK